MPRHPPCALKNLATKMLASTVQFSNNKRRPTRHVPRTSTSRPYRTRSAPQRQPTTTPEQHTQHAHSPAKPARPLRTQQRTHEPPAHQPPVPPPPRPPEPRKGTNKQEPQPPSTTTANQEGSTRHDQHTNDPNSQRSTREHTTAEHLPAEMALHTKGKPLARQCSLERR